MSYRQSGVSRLLSFLRCFPRHTTLFAVLHSFRCLERLRCSLQSADMLTDCLIYKAHSITRQHIRISALLPMQIYYIHIIARGHMHPLLSFQPLRSLLLRSGLLRSSSFNTFRIRPLASSKAVSVSPTSGHRSVVPSRVPEISLTDLFEMNFRQKDTDC